MIIPTGSEDRCLSHMFLYPDACIRGRDREVPLASGRPSGASHLDHQRLVAHLIPIQSIGRILPSILTILVLLTVGFASKASSCCCADSHLDTS